MERSTGWMIRGTSSIARIVDLLWVLLAITLPFSIKIFIPHLGIELIFPSEPLIGVLALIYLFLFTDPTLRPRFSHGAFRDFTSAMVLVLLGTHIVATILSPMPSVAWKATVVQVLYIGLFFVATRSTSPAWNVDLDRLLDHHAKAFLLVLAYAISKQSLEGFDRAGSNHASFPFYVDHTIFSTAMVFVFFRIAGTAAVPSNEGVQVSKRVLYTLLASVLLIGIALSFSRGAWLSVFAVLLLLFLASIPMKLRIGLLGACCVAAVFLLVPVQDHIRRTSADSGVEGTGFGGTLRSITDLSSDRSNLDRLLRWEIALNMFLARPLFGHGPGTYQFLMGEYLPDETVSSHGVVGDVALERIVPAYRFGNLALVRNDPHRSPSSGGTAHSEYLLRMAEVGLFSTLALLALVCSVIRQCWLNMTKRGGGRKDAHIIAAGLGLVAYFVHALVNNFMDDCKVAMLIWLSLRLMVNDLQERSGSRRVAAK